MIADRRANVTIVASRRELPEEARIWGTGGWLPPEDREALDWLTLVHLLGWQSRVAYAEDAPESLADCPIVIVACDAERLQPEWVPAIQSLLDTKQVLAVTRRQVPLNGAIAPSAHPGEMRDAGGSTAAGLKHLLLDSPKAEEALDLAGTVVLRMDDPGGSQNIFSRRWCYSKLDRASWSRVGEILAGFDARMSVGYISGWVDDGDAARGRLTIGGEDVERVPGSVYDSSKVCYEDFAGHRPGSVSDYVAEYESLRELQERGLVTMELHGYTHLHPDRATWSKAVDRYDSVEWYRELGRGAVPFLSRRPRECRPIALGTGALIRTFGTAPTTLISPGEDFTELAMEDALDSGLDLIGSYYLGMRIGDRLCWSTHVCAPYLDLAEKSWFEPGMPVVGYFHDRDLVEYGTGWLEQQLDRWVRAGARRFIDYRQLAAMLREESRF